jgi:hypothetical protein
VSEPDRLRRLFRDLHADDAPAPDYRSLVARGRASASGRAGAAARPAPRLVARAAWALAAAVAAGAVILARRLPTAPTEDQLLRLAASLSTVEAPTDFLLTTPGAAFLQSAPRLGTGADRLTGDPTDLLQDDSNEMEVFE